MNPNACHCPRCVLAEQILDRLTEADVIDAAARRGTSTLRVCSWVEKGHTLNDVDAAIAAGKAGREAEGSTVPLNIWLIDSLMFGIPYQPIGKPNPCIFATRPPSWPPYRADGQLPPATGDA